MPISNFFGNQDENRRLEFNGFSHLEADRLIKAMLIIGMSIYLDPIFYIRHTYMLKTILLCLSDIVMCVANSAK